ncbi:MAG: hypothetical protein UV73_C0002G0165 [Candidatus Gottesmanbacteria bacterium GW2011_GWA2_43_14]|uniref:SGNH hydrolase-type esterase domain-containing protein n=1 Tax=Candidatus Gottesmanbacteria bacterium GW2011_GWA2_43_14 TaxID=1618443 RepID=A0A0G1FTW8_9BACT|nr:MAG: hypothetical protein UV73_C0002G0165 [Candidatus Gottesmanbacteria bacterium GW2011_GWA2_43_14]
MNKFNFNVLLLMIISVLLLIYLLRNKNNQNEYMKYISDIQTNIEFLPSGKLGYFYEPEKNRVITKKPEWPGKSVVHAINADGMHEDREYPLEKTEGTFRIIALGDSFTYGVYVETAENWTEVLERELSGNSDCSGYPKFEVLNLGVSGYDLEYTAERLNRTGLKYSPDLVVWLVSPWNFTSINEYSLPLQEKYIRELPVNSDTLDWRDAVNQSAEDVMDKLGLAGMLNYQSRVLAELRRDYGGKLLFVGNGKIPGKYSAVIKELAEKDGNIVYEEISDVTGDKSLKLPDNHPNPAGHGKIAAEILAVLTDMYFPDCRFNPPEGF